ncbi:MAG: hypothetical protein JST76_00840 [Bacteroidetes bacterium]|nr:hypothetical protein [Bacteroidota bacterium]
MSVTLTQGIAPYLLQDLKTFIGANDPSVKITPAGMLRLAVEQSPDIQIPDYERLRLNNSLGQVSDIRYWTYERSTRSGVQTTRDCDTQGTTPLRKEYTLQAPKYAQISFSLPTDFLERYTAEAVSRQSVEGSSSPLMEEFVRLIMSQIPGLIDQIDYDLVNSVSFGRNVLPDNGPTGTPANTRLVNINKDANVFDLTQGVAQLLYEAELNELYGGLSIVGNGLFHQFSRHNDAGSVTAGLSGLNNAVNTGDYRFYYDPKTASGSTPFGQNMIGVFSQGSVGFIDVNRLVGFKRLDYGTYQAFQIVLPIETGSGTPATMAFDVEMRFSPCGYDVALPYGNVQTLNAGWTVTISKTYGLYQLDTSIYNGSDTLHGSNGALRYLITNDAVSIP